MCISCLFKVQILYLNSYSKSHSVYRTSRYMYFVLCMVRGLNGCAMEILLYIWHFQAALACCLSFDIRLKLLGVEVDSLCCCLRIHCLLELFCKCFSERVVRVPHVYSDSLGLNCTEKLTTKMRVCRIKFSKATYIFLYVTQYVTS